MKGKLKFGNIILLVLSVAVLTTGCKTRRVIEKSPLVKLSESVILEQVEAAAFDYRTLNAKVAVNISSEEANGSFKINLRMAEDSVIWMSIVPALGIEAARALITKDTLKFIDKLKDRYYVGEYSFLDTLVQYNTEFSFLENLLIGNPLEILPSEKYTSVTDDLYYVIQTKNPRKVRKALDLSKKPQAPDSTLSDIVKEKKFQKALEKFEDEDLVIKRYYIRAADFRVERTIIEDLLLQRTVILDYDNFEPVNGTPFPMSAHMRVTTPKETATFEIDYSRIRVNEPQSYPFKIPDKYEPLR